jgi:hypothetical protein
MSNTDDLAEQKPIEQEEDLQTASITAKPLHRQFYTKLMAIVFTLFITLALIFTLFYQQSERRRLLIDGELAPLKQRVEQLQALQKAEYLVNELLFTNSGINFVELQEELIAVNRHLLRLESSNEHLYQQWLNANKSASDIVMRIQQSSGQNEQLKQSSIIQLQLMWFSVTPIINKKTAQQELLFKQLQTDPVNNKLTISRTNGYVSATRQLHNLQQLKSLLAEVLTRFEQLTIHTSMEDFELIRLGVDQIFAQRNVFKTDDQTKAMVDFNQQIDTFEEIVLTEQRALAKWQGYIRLEQSYQLDLKMQKHQLIQILSKPQEKKSPYLPSMVNDLRIKFKINITQQELSLILLLAISLCLLFFCYILWRLREQIKLTAQESVVLIHKSILAENSGDVKANCAETQEIMRQVQRIAKPAHDEQEFQQLLQQCRTLQQVIDEQAQALAVFTQKTNKQQLNTSEQVALHLNGELQRYKHLEGEILSFLQQQQTKLVNKATNDGTSKAVQTSSLIPVYEQLRQFYLASDIRSENTVQTLTDVNLIDEIHAILMNKEAVQQPFNNQLYFSYDDQLLLNAKLDFNLFQQLINLLLEISLRGCQSAQLHLHLQLQDKSSGQQLVYFVVKVKGKALEALPDLVSLLIDSQTMIIQKSPLVDIFNTIFAKQHGENITAQLIDDGFKLNFELPLAIASSSVVKEHQEHKLDGIKVLLLSNNEMLTGLLKKSIHSASGQFEVLTRLDSFEQQLTAKQLSKHKLDLLILTGDITPKSINLITKQVNSLPHSLQPKMMVLQSGESSFDSFGFYSQTEQLLFKDMFLQNIKELLVSKASTNQLLTPEQCQKIHYLAGGLPVILAVNSPQQYRNFQRFLRCLGLQVHVVSHADAQRELWKTGLYCLLFTEFPETSLLKMASKPLVDVAVFSLTDVVPISEDDSCFEHWHIGQISEQSTLEDLSVVLAPWLQFVDSPINPESSVIAVPEDLGFDESNCEDNDGEVITELVASLAGENKEGAFDFSQYLHHQGSVELALFMLDDYGQDNHQQLDIMLNALKAKDFAKAKKANINLQLNAKILVAPELEKLCSQWSKLLSGSDIPSSLKEVNILLKETREALNAIDGYAESI